MSESPYEKVINRLIFFEKMYNAIKGGKFDATTVYQSIVEIDGLLVEIEFEQFKIENPSVFMTSRIKIHKRYLALQEDIKKNIISDEEILRVEAFIVDNRSTGEKFNDFPLFCNYLFHRQIKLIIIYIEKLANSTQKEIYEAQQESKTSYEKVCSRISYFKTIYFYFNTFKFLDTSYLYLVV